MIVVPSFVNAVHPAPTQRSRRYPATPTSSVAAPHDRLIAVPLTTEAVNVPGALGGCVSGVDGAIVVTSFAPLLAPFVSPPPETATILVTLDAALAPTSTVSVIVG